MSESQKPKAHSLSVPPVLRLALLLGVCAHLAGFLFFRVISNPLPDRVDEPAFVSFIDSESLTDDASLEEQAMLFDSAPLFIPGRWSSTAHLQIEESNIASRIFQDFEPEMDILAELKPGRVSLFEGAEVETPEDMLDLRFWDLFQYFGEGATDVVTFEDWSALAEVRVVNSPESAKIGRLINYKLDVGPVDELFLSDGPAIFVIAMSAPGIPSGSPALQQSSGVDELDSVARRWLLRPETLASLPAGYLEVRVYL